MNTTTNNLKTFTLHNLHELPQYQLINKELLHDIQVVAQVLPFKTNNYVAENLIDWKHIENDPIFTLNFPRKEMLDKKHFTTIEKSLQLGVDRNTLNQQIQSIRLALNPNPAGQELNVPQLGEIKVKGIQHKYPETLLFFPSQGQTCHAFCTFCFRWPQFSGINSLKFAVKEMELVLKYLKLHEEITDVLFTGGDPMVMNATMLASYITPLLEPDFEHVRSIRIGTKALTYWPHRFVDDKDSMEILKLFELIQKKKNLAVQAHFNHPRELSTKEVEVAIRNIRNTGAHIRTQSPLLQHINDKPELWSTMWRKQVDMGCIPYYMFVPRDTGAKHFFELPLEKAWNVFRKAYRNVSGLCRTVRGPSMSCTYGKVQVLGIQEVYNEKVFVLRFIQARNPKWVDVPFFAKYDPKATWIDQLKPALGHTNFFFHDNKHKYDKNDKVMFE